MRKVIEFFSEFIFETVTFIVCLSFAIILFQTKERERIVVEDDVKQKYNVYEITGEYETEKSTKSAAEVLADIKSADVNLSIKVNGYQIPKESRKKMKEYNDASGVLRYLDARWNYEVEYSINNNGQVVEVVYEPVF